MVTREFHGWTGEGKTATEAKENAKQNCERAAEGYYTPKSITYRGYSVVIFRDPSSWSYFLICPNEKQGELRARFGPAAEGWHKEEVVTRAALRHLANITHLPGEIPTVPTFLTNEEDRKDYVRDALWQNGYKKHRDENPNATDNQCRAAASEYKG